MVVEMVGKILHGQQHHDAGRDCECRNNQSTPTDASHDVFDIRHFAQVTTMRRWRLIFHERNRSLPASGYDKRLQNASITLRRSRKCCDDDRVQWLVRVECSRPYRHIKCPANVALELRVCATLTPANRQLWRRGREMDTVRGEGQFDAAED